MFSFNLYYRILRYTSLNAQGNSNEITNGQGYLQITFLGLGGNVITVIKRYMY